MAKVSPLMRVRRTGKIAKVERKPNGERRPLTELGADVDGPVQALDPALDDVHADAPAGDVGDRLPAGAQAGVPDELDELVLVEPPRLVLAQQAVGHRLCDGRCSLSIPGHRRSR